MASLEDLRIDPHPQAPPRRGPSWPVVVAWLAVCLALGGFAGARWAGRPQVGTPSRTPPPPDPTASAGQTPAPPASGFTAAGFVEVIPPGPIGVASRVAGWVAGIEALEGTAVRKGDLLVRLDPAPSRQALREAETEAARYKARLDQLEAGARPEEIAGAEAGVSHAVARIEAARAEAKRAGHLVELGAAPRRRLEEARAALAQAEAEGVAAEAVFALRKAGPRPEEIAVARADLAHAEARAERARWELEQCEVRAPEDGVVLERFVRPGDPVGPDEPPVLLTLFDPARMQIRVEVAQREASRVAVGDPVSIRADALPGELLEGRVESILPRANLQRNTLEMKIEFTRPPAGRLYPDMSAHVTFLPISRAAKPEGAASP